MTNDPKKSNSSQKLESALGYTPCPVGLAGTSNSNSRLFDNLNESVGLLTASDVAKTLGISVKTVYLWAKIYRIPCVNLGRCVRFRPEDIAAIRTGQRSLA